MEYKTVSLADQVFERLEADILSGRFKRGETITELQLCAELGVSRTPVREALRRLYQEHLVEDSGKATVVLGISPQDFRDMCEIRIRIEGLEADSVVQIYNALGELVKTVKAEANGEIDIIELAKGLYLVRCGAATLRFVKE